MTEPLNVIAISSFALLGLSLSLLAALKGWQGWLELKRLELTGAQKQHQQGNGIGELIELADLKERIRKLESIAACVDL
jgi:hypothetical protein